MKTAKPIISIIIPTLRRADSVDRLLQSLFEQNYDLRRVEVIVAMNVKDPEQELRIEQKWKSKLNIKGVSTGVMGVNKARNLGMEHASGEIFLLLDDDMELLQKDILQKHEEYHSDAELMGLGGSCAMPNNASIPALAYHIIGLTWMYRYRRPDGKTPYLLGGHASYKRAVFDNGARFNSEIEFGAAETEFNLRLYHDGKVLKYATELRPIHHNDVKPRNFIRKAFLQGYNGALRKESVDPPKPVLKYAKALKKTMDDEKLKKWQRPLLFAYIKAYDYASQQGKREALGSEPVPHWKKKLLRWIGNIKS